MSQYIHYHNDQLVTPNTDTYLWNGNFSSVHSKGPIISMITELLSASNCSTDVIIPCCDGDTLIENYPTAIIGTLAQPIEQYQSKYVYLPLDDHIFINGIIDSFDPYKIIS